MRAESSRHIALRNDAGLQPAWCSGFATQSCGLGYYEAGRWPFRAIASRKKVWKDEVSRRQTRRARPAIESHLDAQKQKGRGFIAPSGLGTAPPSYLLTCGEINK